MSDKPYTLRSLAKALFPKGPQPTFTLTGADYALYIKAKTIIKEPDENFPNEFLRNAARLYRDYILTTMKEGGHYSRVWKGAGQFDVLDMPSPHGQTFLTVVLKGQSRSDVEEVIQIAGLKSEEEFWLRAVRLYSTMVVESHYGWMHFRHGSRSPDGGEPVLEEDGIDTSNMIRFSPRVIKGGRDIAAHLELK